MKTYFKKSKGMIIAAVGMSATAAMKIIAGVNQVGQRVPVVDHGHV